MQENISINLEKINQIKKNIKKKDCLRYLQGKSLLSTKRAKALENISLFFHKNSHQNISFDKTTPCGIKNFENNLFKKQFEKEKIKDNDLLGLYIMGSFGGLAQEKISDIDIWVVIKTNILVRKKKLLENKAKLIREIYLKEGLEVNFFIIDPDFFKKENNDFLTCESSANLQKFLLLDEFYRSSICLCGSNILWYLVPTCTKNYNEDAEFIKKKYLKKEEYIDFGDIGQIDADEYVLSALWQVYKSTNSPFKSILKSTLIENYLHRTKNFIANDVKFFLHSNKVTIQNIAKVDPYFLLIKSNLLYLEEIKDDFRIRAQKECFYLKIKDFLEGNKNNKSIDFLKNYIKNWNWSEKKLEKLKNISMWNINDILKFNQKIKQNQQIIYQKVQKSLKSGAILWFLNDNLKVIAKKVSVLLDQHKNKINLINFYFFKYLPQEKIYIKKIQNKYLVLDKNLEILIKNKSLLQVLTWCYVNNIITKNTEISTTKLDLKIIKRILDDIKIVLDKNKLSKHSYQNLTKKSSILKICSFNFSLSTGRFLFQKRTDIETVIINSHFEIFVYKIRNKQLLFNFIQEKLQLLIKDHTNFQLFNYIVAKSYLCLEKEIQNKLEELKKDNEKIKTINISKLHSSEKIFSKASLKIKLPIAGLALSKIILRSKNRVIHEKVLIKRLEEIGSIGTFEYFLLEDAKKIKIYLLTNNNRIIKLEHFSNSLDKTISHLVSQHWHQTYSYSLPEFFVIVPRKSEINIFHYAKVTKTKTIDKKQLKKIL